MKTLRIAALTTVAALALSGCGGGATSEPGAAGSATGAAADSGDSTAAIKIQSIAFKPASMKVLSGTEVTWTNNDKDVAHTATSGKPGTRAVAGVSKGSDPKPDGVFDGDLTETGSTFSFTFNEPGTFSYFCEIHPSMTGEIVVE